MTKKEFELFLIQELDKVKKEQAAGEAKSCPRCGAVHAADTISKWPTSRFEDVRICQECKQQEDALYNKHGVILKLHEWSFAQPHGDPDAFENVTVADAWVEIERDQVPALLARFVNWQHADRDDAVAYSYETRRDFKGVLDAQYAEGATIRYYTSDGEIMLLIRERGGKLQYAARAEGKMIGVRWLTEE